MSQRSLTLVLGLCAALPALAQWPDARQFTARCLQESQQYGLPLTVAQLSSICRCTHGHIARHYTGKTPPSDDAEFRRRILEAAQSCTVQALAAPKKP